ncbi:unnamed protein product [Nippostrongylus brasiliensis]|uniref:Ell-associated factor Eaf n=1 Tax=Nippostrongylus brasiliensis TaxID=27835 RepID=A0A158QZN5_NIPBR|nr:unnamed protein product [Nippostrongylus brasiliensis]
MRPPHRDDNKVAVTLAVCRVRTVAARFRQFHCLGLGACFSLPASCAMHGKVHDFKPMSVASSDSDTYIAFGANGDVHVAVPTEGENMTVFKGSKKEAKAKECLLFFDKKTGKVRLEKIASNINVKKTRLQCSSSFPGAESSSSSDSSSDDSDSDSGSGSEDEERRKPRRDSNSSMADSDVENHLLESMKASAPPAFSTESIDMPSLDSISQPPPQHPPSHSSSYQSRTTARGAVTVVSNGFSICKTCPDGPASFAGVAEFVEGMSLRKVISACVLCAGRVVSSRPVRSLGSTEYTVADLCDEGIAPKDISVLHHDDSMDEANSTALFTNGTLVLVPGKLIRFKGAVAIQAYSMREEMKEIASTDVPDERNRSSVASDYFEEILICPEEYDCLKMEAFLAVQYHMKNSSLQTPSRRSFSGTSNARSSKSSTPSSTTSVTVKRAASPSASSATPKRSASSINCSMASRLALASRSGQTTLPDKKDETADAAASQDSFEDNVFLKSGDGNN